MEKHFEQIPVGKLEVDTVLDTDRIFVQRNEQEPWTNSLIANWRQEMLLPALISHRKDGRYIILDGQHSNKAAIAKEGADYLRDCMVYVGLSAEEEANLFLAANRYRKAVRPYDNYRVSLTAKDPIALRVDKEVHAVVTPDGKELDVAASPSTNRIAAVQALLTLGQVEGRVQRVLTITSKTWGVAAASWDNLVLRALGMLFEANEGLVAVNDARLIKILKKETPAVWKQNSVKVTSGGGGSASRSSGMVDDVVAAYNKGLHKDKWLYTTRPSKSKLAKSA